MLSTIFHIFKLLAPFLNEFGLSRGDVVNYIIDNRVLAYFLVTSLGFFVLFTYAIEQAHMRLHHQIELMAKVESLNKEVEENRNKIAGLQKTCVPMASESEKTGIGKLP